MNRQLRRVGAVVLLMFVALLCSTTIIQVFSADQLAGDPRNSRTLDDSYSAERGEILDADGNGQGPRVLTNGKGTACLAYKFLGDCGLKDGYISQCSSDNGATWTAPKAIVTDLL